MHLDSRVRKLNDGPVPSGARYVLYDCRRNPRVESNHALAFAALLANRYDLPLVCFQSVSCDHPDDNDRIHTFALEGVPQFATALRKSGIGHLFHLRRRKRDRSPVPELLLRAAALVVDDYPSILDPRPYDLTITAYAVESSCVVPPACIPAAAYAAYSIRPKIHKLLPQFLKPAPAVRPSRRYDEPTPAFHTQVEAGRIPALVADCEIDHSVGPLRSIHGGRRAGEKKLRVFLDDRLRRYAREKNEPAKHATSGLSPYLHFGHISALEVALAVREHAREHKLVAEEFLEELIVRRELAFNYAWHGGPLDRLDGLPHWARETLDRHRKDRRDPVYTPEEFGAAATHDNLWNATQKELLLRGTIHGYYRMYWGKKILEWSRSPEEALATMIGLHDRFALDGRDPNTYGNILWCFGLHDRPWPERPIYGKIRSMSLAGMERKTDASAYIKEIEFLERTGKELTT